MKTKTTFILFAAILFCSLLIIQLGCKKDDNGGFATVTTATITNITRSTATSGGNVSDDGGSAVTARGVCWSTNQNPTLSDEYTIDGIVTGTFISEITGLAANTTYYVRAYATNSEGSGYGNQETFATPNGGGGGEPCPGIPTITYEEQVYNTVLIGSQCWLKENLNYETGSSWCFDNNPANCEIYGRLYDWQTALTACPSGWHLPSDDEWKILEGTVDSQYPIGDPEWDNIGPRGYDAGKKLKSTTGWYSGGNGTNDFGFDALPGGYHSTLGNFYALTGNASFWSSSDYSSSYAWSWVLYYGNDGVSPYLSDKVSGFSARCLQD
ncbi:MAG: hypothetical protein JEY97_05970 [Bacteroidales bacterium]|nr:hypothetical protein [Bacteroidales bacterium]